MTTRPVATTHLPNIAANWRLLNAAAGPGRAGAVVKANAYGHGVFPVVQRLCREGCQTFFVAYDNEGADVRRSGGPQVEIYAFNGEGDAREKVRPVINTLDALKDWVSGGGGPYALHIDTGMNRLGISWSELSAAAALARNCPPALVMTHLACADEPASAMNVIQARRFSELREAIPAPSSFANSAGHWLGEAFASDVSRPGIALYGGDNSPLRPAGILPGLTLEAPILQVRSCAPGETVGYGATARLGAPARIATVALGYGDGFPRSASNSGFAYLGGIRCPIVGRVSMDLITLDVTEAAGLAKEGAMAEFIGPRALLEEQAACAGTLGYELITGLGSRVERNWES